ncbi:hypothetical protein QAD02_020198 [Eretmocerus hayati]|uniref:Uncharacterized protein n=1 Tax=Eretmocerus hayati TaxID=131215 RepID=A0ACC2PMZ8_9HYME|nr:hypothetical protein QAD02_020198 [Eretmocerus hayati]
MHTKIKTPSKEMVELDTSSNLGHQSSFLEDDLALSPSTHDSVSDKTIIGAVDKISLSNGADNSNIVYVSEDAMDCNYDDHSDGVRDSGILEEAPSPELFESDNDDNDGETQSTNTTYTYPNTLTLEETQPSLPTPKKYAVEELILKADKHLFRRLNKFLSGVPPPPNHTISQKDCNDFLAYIKQNQEYFWANPFQFNEELKLLGSEPIQLTQETAKNENPEAFEDFKDIPRRAKSGLRNLSTAFDACEQSNQSKIGVDEIAGIDSDFPDSSISLDLPEIQFDNSSITCFNSGSQNDESKLCNTNDQSQVSVLYTSLSVNDAPETPWPASFGHRCHDIYYNRNRATENFENLRMKLCDRYIGAETQSTCNIWFAKQMPGSARKRSLLAKRKNGQSPGRRLSYLARRRRTFSSANLQGLAEKKQPLLDIRKGRKGKSPRGKSPRIKSPRRRTPRSSAKKRQLRKLLFDGTSPRKTKIETSKRALFQSPPNDKPGPSRVVVSSSVINNNPQKIKRALFPTPKKKEGNDSKLPSLSYPESRKRKNEDDLENPKHKWAKSLSFDCPRNLDRSSSNSFNPMRYSTGSISSRDSRNELYEIHQKKLLWAATEALRSTGIGTAHPMYKQYRSSLACTVRKNMPDLDNKHIPRKPGSTTDRMLKLAKRHVLLLVEGKSTS